MGWSMDWVHGPGPWGGPWTSSIGWSMDPGPCFVYVQTHERSTGYVEFKDGRQKRMNKALFVTISHEDSHVKVGVLSLVQLIS